VAAFSQIVAQQKDVEHSLSKKSGAAGRAAPLREKTQYSAEKRRVRLFRGKMDLTKDLGFLYNHRNNSDDGKKTGLLRSENRWFGANRHVGPLWILVPEPPA